MLFGSYGTGLGRAENGRMDRIKAVKRRNLYPDLCPMRAGGSDPKRLDRHLPPRGVSAGHEWRVAKAGPGWIPGALIPPRFLKTREGGFGSQGTKRFRYLQTAIIRTFPIQRAFPLAG